MAERDSRDSPDIIEFTPEEAAQHLATANEIANPVGLTAEYLGNARAVGVVGDNRAFTPVINLIGLFPGHDVLAEVSTKISNTIPIVKVTYEFAAGEEEEPEVIP